MRCSAASHESRYVPPLRFTPRFQPADRIDAQLRYAWTGGWSGAGGRLTRTVADPEAEPPRPSVTRTVIRTEPAWSGARQRAVVPDADPMKRPCGALQRYDSGSSSGSEAFARRRASSPVSTSHGSQGTVTRGGRLSCGGATTRTPGSRAVRPSARARMLNPPACRAVTRPAPSTVATVVLLDDHSASTFFRTESSDISRSARSWTVWPTSSSGLSRKPAGPLIRSRSATTGAASTVTRVVVLAV